MSEDGEKKKEEIVIEEEQAEDEQGDEEVNPNAIKIVAVGDGTVGKTCLLTCFATNKFPTDYIPTIFDSTSTTMDYKGRVYELSLWDTAGQAEYDRLRPLSYTNADVFLICFSLVSPYSLENVQKKWASEIRHYSKKASIILVGTKFDLSRIVTEEQGLFMKKNIGSEAYVECSAKTAQNVKKVFECAIEIAVAKRGKKIGKSSANCCVVL